MLQGFFSILPNITLVLAVLHLWIMYLLEYDQPRAYAKVAKFWLLLSVFLSIIFYETNIGTQYIVNNAYTLVFKLFIAFLIYLMLGSSVSWFTTLKKNNCAYNSLILLAFLAMNVLLSSVNLITMVIAFSMLGFVNFLLIRVKSEQNITIEQKRYLSLSFIMCFIMFLGTTLLAYNLKGSLDFGNLYQFIKSETMNIGMYLSVIAIIIPYLFVLSLVPFHIVAEDKISKVSLPVSHFLAVIEPLAYWGAFFKFNATILPIYQKELSLVYIAFGVLSLFLGGMGTNVRINLHKIYTNSAIYYNGVILILLSYFTKETDFTAFICLFVFTLSLNCSYLIFYNLKSHGTYLSTITHISGIAETRPYITAALLVSLFSMIGLPPLAGFCGQLNVLNELVAHKNFILLGIMLFFLLFIAKAYLEIIKTVYFEQKTKNFDTENKLVLWYTILNVCLILTITFNPFNLFSILKDLFYVIYI